MSFQTYNLNIPNPPNSPQSDVPLMQTNANSIANLVLQDHFGFNDNAGGNHKQVHLKNEAAPGGLGANADGVFYANLANGQSWPFWQNALGSIQLGGRNFLSTNGYITLPSQGSSPLIVQWGVEHAPGVTFQNDDFGTVTFATNNIVFPNDCFVVFATLSYSIPFIPGEMGVIVIESTTLTKTSFTWTYPQNSNQYDKFYWIALGN